MNNETHPDTYHFTHKSPTEQIEKEQPDVNLFLNSAKDHFTIRSDFLITHITISDMSGRVIYNQPVNSNETCIEKQWDAGMYIVSITTAEGVFVRKVQMR